jgi:hypothetical protein
MGSCFPGQRIQQAVTYPYKRRTLDRCIKTILPTAAVIKSRNAMIHPFSLREGTLFRHVITDGISLPVRV